MADLHGYLPEPVDCDLAIVAGDICPEKDIWAQGSWLETAFCGWCERWPCMVYYIAGNHDKIFATYPSLAATLAIRGVYLEDRSTKPFAYDDNHPHKDLSIFGTPWSLKFGQWSFMTDEEGIARHLPDQYHDIIVSHGPPKGVADIGLFGEHAGSKSLRDYVLKYKPKLVVCGHLHEGYGIHDLDGVKVVNASYMNESFRPKNPPIVIELGD